MISALPKKINLDINVQIYNYTFDYAIRISIDM